MRIDIFAITRTCLLAAVAGTCGCRAPLACPLLELASESHSKHARVSTPAKRVISDTVLVAETGVENEIRLVGAQRSSSESPTRRIPNSRQRAFARNKPDESNEAPRTLFDEQITSVEAAGLDADVDPQSIEDSLAADLNSELIEPSADQYESDAAEDDYDDYTVDLPTALRLAGANNWSVRLATERVREARARWQAARVLWLPSLRVGMGYNKHDGQIQDTRGDVIEVSRNSFFLGGGAGVGGAPLNGASGGPARFFVDLSLADAIFKPLAARQLVRAEQARESATFNDTLLAVALAYYNLVATQAQHDVARQNAADAQAVMQITQAFVEAGKGPEADISRVGVEVSRRRQTVIQAEMEVQVASAELARLLQLEPNTSLRPQDATLMPVEWVADSTTLQELIDQARSVRPEVAERQARLEAGRYQVRAERFRPYIPNLYVGTSAGGFGGGVNNNLRQLDGRSDVDLLAVWELKNLGLGTRAAQREQSSQFRQALLDTYRIRDQVAAEVATAYHSSQAHYKRLSLAEANIQEAETSYDRNLARIRGLQGLPLEVLQAVQAVAGARHMYLEALLDYDRAQLQLLRAIGRPVGG